jgi:hypothetical protein
MFSPSHIIKLTVVLYKVSDFFPEKEPLKFLIRKKANEILAGLILQEKDVEKDIEVMEAFLELAEQQDWVKRENFKILKKEYSLVGDNLKPVTSPKIIVGEAEKQERQKINLSLNLGPRHSKIIEILKKGKPIQVKDLKDIFPNVSKRTLRRDFEYLLEKKLVERIGDNNSTEYKLRSR